MDYVVDDFIELAQIIKENTNKEVHMHISNNNLTLTSGDAALYIRLWNKKKITISSIDLENKRMGTGTKILEWFKQLALENNIQIIEMENTCTIAICKFCEKHKFKKIVNQFSPEYDGIFWGSWELKL